MIIKCEDKYKEAMDHAEKTGDKSLQNCFERLKSWEKNGTQVHLYKDSSPYSFYFEEIRQDGRRGLDGGVLYHGNPDQSFSVTMNKTIGWQIHT